MADKSNTPPGQIPFTPEDDITNLVQPESDVAPQSSPVSPLPNVEDDYETFAWTDESAQTQPFVDETITAAGRRRVPRTPPTDRRPQPRKPKSHLFVTLCHWSMVGFLALSLISGMRLGWGYVNSALGGTTGWWANMLNSLAPQGSLWGINLITLHVTLSFFMLGTVGIYVGYMFFSGASRRLRLKGKYLQAVYKGASIRAWLRDKQALWSANLLVYWLSFAMIAVLLVTGFTLYRPEWLGTGVYGGYDNARLLHALIAYLLVPYTVLHMVLQWLFGRFWNIFKAQLYGPHIRAGLIGIALTLPVIAGLYVWAKTPTTLTAKRITGNQKVPVLDGDSSDPVWRAAESVIVDTVKAVNTPGEVVKIEVKALHDDTYVYFLFGWDDPAASYKRFPLMKTADGWRVLQTALEHADEDVYYEDKLAMYITDVTNGSCAATCHVGAGPYGPSGQKHGLHYTNGEVGDVWHWKSVRTNNMHLRRDIPGYMDDQHFRAPDLPMPIKPKKRYSGGYHADPKTGGGYSYNYTKLDPDKPLAETLVRPIMLPRRLDIKPNADPTTSEHRGTWWIHKQDALQYTEAQDTYPEGTLLQNILIEPFQGDRADVRAKGQWHNGRWVLEVRRVLDTHSQYDVPFIPGKPVYISVGAFNRTQTRHSEHIEPVRLILQK